MACREIRRDEFLGKEYTVIRELRYRLSEWMLEKAHDPRYYVRWHDTLEYWGYRIRPRWKI